MIEHLENFIKTEEEVKEIEDKLIDYDSLHDLTKIVDQIFNIFIKKINQTIKLISDKACQYMTDYALLEN